MDHRAEIREFLTTRRAKITPEQAGVPLYGGRRRVPGLRREEVALVAGVSIDYYTRLEKGNIAGVSEEVLGAVATALQLDEAERAHLFDLARSAKPMRTPRRQPKPTVRPSIQRILDSMVGTPAFVRNARLDVLAINPLGRALYAPAFEDTTSPANLARFNFLDPRAEAFYPQWDDTSNTTVALLRTEAGRDPCNRELSDLIGELATRSEDFRVRWAAHDVRLPPDRGQASAPPGRRLPGAGLRGHGATGRSRPDADRLHGGAGITVSRRLEAARQLGGTCTL